MNYTFPAAPGTLMLSYHPDDGKVSLTPVVGWSSPTGLMAFPVVAVGGRSMGPLQAIEHGPEGLVSYPTASLVFKDRIEWARYMRQNSPADAEDGNEEPSVEEMAEDAGTASHGGDKGEGGPDTKPLVFGTKTYATKSFWHWESANAVFEIEGGGVYPNDPRAVKIKRDEFFTLKREGAAKIDPHAGLILADSEQEPEAGDENDLGASYI